jgi:thiosulfate/3-mercaptopyruvate sulfurtransferase
MPSGCFQLFGHTNARIMDGGRLKWEKEGRELTREKPAYPATTYRAHPRDDSRIRAFRDQVLAHAQAQGQLVDVRSPAEYSGERTHMEGYPNEGRCAAGTSPARATSPGRGRPILTTAPLSRPGNCARSTSRNTGWIRPSRR